MDDQLPHMVDFYCYDEVMLIVDLCPFENDGRITDFSM